MSAAPVLKITRNGETVKEVQIEGEAVLGRSEGCVIRLEDRAISRQHVVFRPTADGVQVEKKSEFAPLTVNGSECTRAIVKEGDVISIGPYLMRIAPGKGGSENHASIPAPKLTEVPTAQKEILGGDPSISSPLAPALPAQKDSAPLPEGGPELAISGDPAGSGVPEIAGLSPALQESASPESGPDLVLEPPSNEEEGTDFVASGSVSDQPSMQIADENAATKVNTIGKVSVRLVFKPGTSDYAEYPLNEDRVTLGRGKNCTIVLNDKKASREHAEVVRVGLGFVIKDLESANGTYVNGKKVQEHSLSGDDIIRIGNAEIQFKAVSSDYEEQAKNFMALPAISVEPAEGISSDEPSPLSPATPASEPVSSGNPVPAPSPAANPGMFPSQYPGNTNPVFGVGVGAQPGSGLGGPSLPNISGIAGIGIRREQKKSLMEKFRALPKGRQAIWVVILVALAYFLLLDEDIPEEAPTQKVATAAKRRKREEKKETAAPTKEGKPEERVPASFEGLSKKDRQFIESQHEIAFNYYKNRDYDKALYEVGRIFALVPDYKNSKEIERYAREGKRKLEAIEEERKKREEEAALKAKLNQLLEEGKLRMSKKQFDQAQEIFSQILSIDPENAMVDSWRKDIESQAENKKIRDQQKQVQSEINKDAWKTYRRGMALKNQKKYYPAIAEFEKVKDLGTTNKKVLIASRAMAAQTRKEIGEARDPVLAEAKKAEDGGETTKAFQLYQKASEIDPRSPLPPRGMNRIRAVLHDRAKILYTEAVLAESYSDFTTAKKKYEECMEVAPPDDVYRDRAERKLSLYFNKKNEDPLQ